jgi:hypothetical protein
MHPIVKRTFIRRLRWAAGYVLDLATAVGLAVMVAWLTAQGF